MVYLNGKRYRVCYYNGQKVAIRVNKSNGVSVLVLIPLNE